MSSVHTLMRKYKKWISMFLTALMLFSLVSPQLAAKAASTDPVTLAKWDFSNGTVYTPATGIQANLDKVLSVNGGPTIASTFVTGPETYKVPNASPWTGNPTYWEVPLSTK